MKLIGIISKTSKEDVYVMDAKNNRYIVKENLPDTVINRPVIVYGGLNIKIKEDGQIIQFFNPKLVLTPNGQELWRASKTQNDETSTYDSSEESSPDEDFF